jgi:hypothetical protein
VPLGNPLVGRGISFNPWHARWDPAAPTKEPLSGHLHLHLYAPMRQGQNMTEVTNDYCTVLSLYVKKSSWQACEKFLALVTAARRSGSLL